jgi:hypothetical protein
MLGLSVLEGGDNGAMVAEGVHRRRAEQGSQRRARGVSRESSTLSRGRRASLYGAYVDLIHTKTEPLGTLPLDLEDGSEGAYVDVPTQDLRAIRRAILDLDEFTAAGE